MLKYVGDNEKPVEDQINYILQHKLVKRSVFVTDKNLVFKNKDDYIAIRGVEYFYLLNKKKDALKSTIMGTEYKRDIEIIFKTYDYLDNVSDRYISPVLVAD